MVIVFVRSAIGVTFLVSALSKLIAPSAFIDSLPALGAPRGISRAVGVAVIGTEALVVACMLVGGLALIAGACLAAALLVLFSAVLARALRNGVSASCHCFGRGGAATSRVDLVRNGGLLLVLLCGGVVVARTGLPSVTSMGGASPHVLIDSIVAAAAGLGFAMVWSQLPEIAQLLTGGSHRPRLLDRS